MENEDFDRHVDESELDAESREIGSIMLSVASIFVSASLVGLVARMWKGRRCGIWAALTLVCETVLYAYTHLGLSGVAQTDSLYRAALILTVGGGAILISIIIATLPPNEHKADA